MTTKILVPDASVIISFVEKLKAFGLFELLHKAGYIMIIPQLLYEKELTLDSTLLAVDKLIAKGIIKLGPPGSFDKVKQFENRTRRMHFGESSVWFEYVRITKEIAQKIGNKEIKEGDIIVICVFDDKGAQKFMIKKKITFLSTEDLINLLEKLKMISRKEKERILKVYYA